MEATGEGLVQITENWDCTRLSYVEVGKRKVIVGMVPSVSLPGEEELRRVARHPKVRDFPTNCV
jgi:hypothetical protein